MMTDKEKLAHIIHHWIEHNEAHMEEYRRWAGTAEKEALPEVHRFIMDAVRGVEEANSALKKAMKAVKG
jgi:hypothetical protein